ncbi:rRNA maturation RNase YbeY [uncultured Kiloniella sp.]|uniref:rRNA maturation RNase YbeY n=1 Tax=uncultured Kiloniella sp. TaxID=1133091 RepID=UPI0026217553|nr:rRNA maturation RNase YbeY [uncultured Kiloniella sp.]
MSDLIMTEALERSLSNEGASFMSSGFDVSVELKESQWSEFLPHHQALIHRAVIASYVFAGFSADPSSSETTLISEAELSVVLANDVSVQALNKEYRGKDKPTNVLSFSTLDDPDEADLASQRGVLPLGDIVLSIETLILEANEQSKRLEDHFSHLLVHGVLHLLGYDHIEDDDALEMEGLEVEILNRLGVNNPYELDGDRLLQGMIDE